MKQVVLKSIKQKLVRSLQNVRSRYCYGVSNANALSKFLIRRISVLDISLGIYAVQGRYSLEETLFSELLLVYCVRVQFSSRV